MCPSFDEVILRFRRFLQAQGRPDTLCWVFPEDSIFLCRTLYLRPQPDTEAIAAARNCYEQAGGRKIPTEIAALGYDEQTTYCFLSVASDSKDITHNNQEDKVKFSIVNTSPPLHLIHNKVLWKLLTYFRGAGAGYVEFLFHRHVGLVVREIS